MIWVVLTDAAERELARYAVPEDFLSAEFDLRLLLREHADQVAQLTLQRDGA